MADVTAARLVIHVKTSAGQANSELKSLNSTLLKSNATLDKNGRVAEKNLKTQEKTAKALGTLKKAFAAIGVGLLIRQFVKLTDTYTNINDKLKLVTNGTDELKQRQKQLFDIAQKSRSSFQSTAELYARLSRSTKQLGVSSEDLLTVTDSINKAFLVSGASSEEASNAIRQLSQGLAAGALRGDEFNSVAEQAPRLQEAIAASLGVTVGELRALAAQGKITSKVIVEALKGQAGVINKEFAQLTPTFSGVAQQLQNAALNIVGALGKELLPDIGALGEAFIALSEDSGLLLRYWTFLLKSVTFLAKGFASLALTIDRSFEMNKAQTAIEFQAGALKRLQTNLQNARKEFELMVKTRPQIIKALEDIANAQRKITETPEERERIKRAKEYLVAIKAQGDVIKNTQADYNNSLDRNKRLEEALAGLIKEKTKLDKEQRKSQAASVASRKRNTKAIKEQAQALQLLAEAGDPSAFIENQRRAFEEQKKIVAKAGLDVAALEKFQQSQRINQYDNFFKQIADDQSLSFEQRQGLLEETLANILALENISNEERLAAQQAYNQQSALLEQQRFQSLANNVAFGAEILGGFNDIAQSLSQFRQNQIQEEINSLEEAGASEEQIAKKRAELQRKAAIDQKRFATFAAILDTATAVTKALASVPPPGSYVLAGISAAKGAAQIAAIRSQPIPKAQFGGVFEVPPGNEADTGLLRINQGERVEVTPTGETGNTETKRLTLAIGEREFDGYLTDKMQSILNSGQITINRTGVVRAG